MTDIYSMLPTIASVVKDTILTAAAVVAGYVGLRGLNTWRRQLAGNAEYELAKSALTCLYRLRDVIEVVRNPLASYSQEPDLPAEQLKNMDAKQKEWYAYVQMYEKRWAPVVEAKSQLDVLLFEMEAIWGREVVAKFKPLSQIVDDLHWAIRDHIDNRNPWLGRQNYDDEEQKKQWAILFRRGSNTPDEYNKRFEAAISDAEAVLKSYVLTHHR